MKLNEALDILFRCCTRQPLGKEESVTEALDSLEQSAKKLEKINNIVYDCFERDRLVPYQAMQEIKKVLEDGNKN